MSNYAVESDPAMEALLKMATTPDAQSKRGSRGEGGVTPTRSELQSISKSRIRAIKSAQDVFRALPELDTICTIAASSILSTKDLVTTTVNYDCVSQDIPLELRTSMLSVVSNYFDNEVGYPKKLYRWIHSAMSVKGATPVMLVSEATISDMFSLRTAVGTESTKAKLVTDTFNKQLGILKDIHADESKPKTALESLLSVQEELPKPQEFTLSFDDEMLKSAIEHTFYITDNPNVLAIGEVQRRLAAENAKRAINPSFRGSYKGDQGVIPDDSDKKLRGQIDERDLLTTKDVNPDADKAQPTQIYKEVKASNRRSSVHPMEKIWPAESLLPIVLGGNEREPIGWLGILDDTGNPISARTAHLNDGAMFNGVSSEVLSENIIARNEIGMGTGQVPADIAQRLFARYAEVAEDKMLEVVSKAIGGGAISLSTSQDWMKIMFQRHLAKRHTQVLYIPADNVAYFATDFNEDGIGVSITERAQVLSTIRMSLMFATMNSAILNSARNLQFDIELGMNDRNAQQTIDRIKAETINTYNNSRPIWGDVDDTLRAATNAGISFNVTGNDWYPDQKVSVSDNTPDYKTPDPEVDEQYLRRTCNLARVDPDLVLTPENIEFASQIFSKSLIVTQQVMKIQEELERPLTTYPRTYIYSSGPLLDALAEKVVEYMPIGKGQSPAEYDADIREIVSDFVDKLKVSLPPPDTSISSAQMEQFDKRMEFFEKLSDVIVDESMADMLSEAGFSGNVDSIKRMVMNYYAKNWLKKNDMESDLFTMLDPEHRTDTIKTLSDDTTQMATLIAQLATRTKGKLSTVIKNYDKESDDEESGMSGGEDGDGFGGGSGSDDEFGGGDDIGGDDVFGEGSEDTGGDDDLFADDSDGGDDASTDGDDTDDVDGAAASESDSDTGGDSDGDNEDETKKPEDDFIG